MSVLERSEGEELDSLVSFSKSPARAAMDVVVNAFGSRGSSGGTSGNINISKKRLRQLESIMVGSDSISDEEEGRVEGTPLSFVTQIGFDCFPKTKKPTLQSEGHRLPEETEEMKPDIVEEPEIENLRLNKASDNVCDTVRDLLKNVANIDQLLEKANKENSGENTIESANVLEEDIFQSDAVENSTSKSTDLTSLKEAATVNSFDGVMKSLSPAQKSSKASITDYFKKTNGLFQLKDASEKLLKLEKLLQEKSDEVIAKDTIITDLQMQLERKHSESVDMNLCFSKEKEQMTQTLVSNIRSLAKRERISRREQISKDNVRIGSIYIRRDGITALEDWVDGELFQELKEMKDSHQADKEFIDNKKRELAKMSKDLSSSSTQDFLSRRREISELQHILNVRIQLWKNQGIEIQKRDSEILYLKQKHMKAIHLVQEEFRSAWNDFPVIKSRYLLLHMVGRGGFSEVWKAFDLEKLSYVAVKIHEVQSEWSESRKTSFIRHAERENRILSNLNHSRIVKCYDIFLINQYTLGTVLEFCEGEDLDMFLRRNHCLSEKIAKSIMFQILRALEYLNSLEERIIHYDLKPSNILFNNGEIKITDFGLSKLMPENSSHHVELTSPGYGSYWYLPPECFRLESGKSTPTISPKVDVWSFGIIFYQLLFGKRPFGDSMFPSKELIDTIVHSNQVEFPNKPVISDAAKNLISDCLSKNESSRPCVKDLLDHPYFTESSLQPTLPKSSKK